MEEVQLDVNEVIEDLLQTIAGSEREKSIMRVQIKTLQAQIKELEESLPQ